MLTLTTNRRISFASICFSSDVHTAVQYNNRITKYNFQNKYCRSKAKLQYIITNKTINTTTARLLLHAAPQATEQHHQEIAAWGCLLDGKREFFTSRSRSRQMDHETRLDEFTPSQGGSRVIISVLITVSWVSYTFRRPQSHPIAPKKCCPSDESSKISNICCDPSNILSRRTKQKCMLFYATPAYSVRNPRVV